MQIQSFAPQTPLRLTTKFSEKSVKGKDGTLTDKKIQESGTTTLIVLQKS